MKMCVDHKRLRVLVISSESDRLLSFLVPADAAQGLTHEGRSALTRGAKDCDTRALRGQSAGSPITVISTLPASARKGPPSAVWPDSQKQQQRSKGPWAPGESAMTSLELSEGSVASNTGPRAAGKVTMAPRRRQKSCLDSLDFHLPHPGPPGVGRT